MSPRSVPVYLWWLLASLAGVLLWSGMGPKERGTWWLEVAPVLGAQGDVWDTQWDMFLVLAGSVAAQVALARFHQRQLDQIRRPSV